MRSNLLSSTPLSRLGLERGPVGIPTTRKWALETLAGRFSELSTAAAGAVLTVATSLVREAQLRGEPAAWIALGGSTFYPPDVAASGVDLDALPVVRVADIRSAMRAADHLLRSGGFAVVVIDLGGSHSVGMSMQSRLAALAKKHRTALLCLTRKRTEAPSIGSLVSLRGETKVTRTAFDRFDWQVDVIKDKRRGPGWQHAATCSGPSGLC